MNIKSQLASQFKMLPEAYHTQSMTFKSELDFLEPTQYDCSLKGRTSMTRAETLRHLKRGNALSQKATENPPKNSVFHQQLLPVTQHSYLQLAMDQSGAKSTPAAGFLRQPKFNSKSEQQSIPAKQFLLSVEDDEPNIKVQIQEKARQQSKVVKGPRLSLKAPPINQQEPPLMLIKNGSIESLKSPGSLALDRFLEEVQRMREVDAEGDFVHQITLEEYLTRFKEEKKLLSAVRQETTSSNVQSKPIARKKFLSSNVELFMNCFQCTSLPSPPNIPISEAQKISNHSQKDRYYKMAEEFTKIKKIIANDMENGIYYARTVILFRFKL